MVSHYELRRRLGAGGMGEVYLAHDTVLQRPVAIKLLLDAHPADREASRQLLREAQAAAALDHPNICAIYEVGTDARGRDFIAMQYIEGETLAARLRHGPLPVRAALDLVLGVAVALDAAHRRGVVHRDLKPQNVMVTPAGSPKLLDFGIARVKPSTDASAAPTAYLDSAGVAGTPPYMAPEVLQGRTADARSDLFSLGVLLYECLTGIRPFRGATPQEVWGRVLHVEPESPSTINRAVDPDLDAVCARLLAKEPGARFQSAAELCGALQVLRTHTSTVPVASPTTRRWPMAAAVAAGVVLVVAAVVLWQRTAFAPLPAPPQAAATWYARGIDAVRQGAYTAGRRALEEAIRLHPDYAMAHARLADVLSALDEERAAQASLIRVSVLVPDLARLPVEDRLRLDGIRAMVLRDFDRAMAAYAELVTVRPDDAGARVDLGRAQEAAGQLVAARASYTEATTLDSQFAAGFLRLGSVLGDTGQLDEALRAFDEAERLYSLTSNEEGRVEALLQRAAKLDAAGRFADTARAADTALQLAREADLLAQECRAGFLRGSAQVGSGAFAEGEATVREYVDKAIGAGLQGIAADGLIDMAGTLLARGRADESDATLVRASAIATERSLTRTAMRAATQRAALKLETDLPREALALLEAPLEYFARTRHRRLEAVALTIAARANQDVGDYARATEQLGRVLAFAAESRNDELTAQASSSLATLAASEGRLPEALEHRRTAVRLRRALGDSETLPYDLANEAEVLIRLGRGDGAAPLLDELDQGIVAQRGAFPTRARRVSALRALLAMTAGEFRAARDHARRVDPDGRRADETGQLASMLGAVAEAMLGSTHPAPPVLPGLDPTSPGAREVQLWRAQALLAAGDTQAALELATRLFEDASVARGVEFEWRAAAVAAMAAHLAGDRSTAGRRADQAVAGFGQLASAWGAAITPYEARRDLSRMLGAVRGIVNAPGHIR